MLFDFTDDVVIPQMVVSATSAHNLRNPSKLVHYRILMSFAHIVEKLCIYFTILYHTIDIRLFVSQYMTSPDGNW